MKHRNAKGCPKLGRRIRLLRHSREETLQELADAARCSKSVVWDIERGNNPNPTIGLVMAFAKHFKTSIDNLVRP